MVYKEYTETYRYKHFDVGEEVASASPRCKLEQGKVYVVKKFIAPPFSGEPSYVIVYPKGGREFEDALVVSSEYVLPKETSNA